VKRLISSECLGLLDDVGGNSVHVGGTLLGEGFSNNDLDTFVRDVLGGADETGSLKLDKAVANVLTGSLTGVLGSSSVVLVATVMLTEGLDTNLSSHVELVSDGGSTVVEPVITIGSEFLEAAGLGMASPLVKVYNY
jgi:hypothetical protein